MFKDRRHAGRLLSAALQAFKGAKDALVIGLARGGVVVADEVAKGLELPLDVMCPRKIGAPKNPEWALGAITETGDGIFDEYLIEALQVSEAYLRKAAALEKEKAQQRLRAFRPGLPPLDVKGKTVILVDDGLATGATMKAALKRLQSLRARKIIVAVPVAPQETFTEIQCLADEAVCLSFPPFFQAVGEFYENFEQTENEEVIAILRGRIAVHEE